MKTFLSPQPPDSSSAGQRRSRWLACLFVLLSLPQLARADAIYQVRQTFTLKDVPADARKIRAWLWMPEDRPEQKVQEFKVTKAPAGFRITRDPRYGRSWLYAEIDARKGAPLAVDTEFKLLRYKVSGMAESSKVRALGEEDKRAFAFELRPDEKHMEVNPTIKGVADGLAKDETNPVILARRFFNYVIMKSDHYSKFGAMPKGKCLGDNMECLAGTGDCCTDQHALFISLCRSRGIPCRLFYGSRLKPENEGKEHDPGYRCWPNFFAPGVGWIPLDISSGDTAGDKAEDWFGGLDENRVEWAEGRDFELEPKSKVRPDLVIRGWVEIDGKPHTGLVRTVRFTRTQVPAASQNTASK